MTASEIRRMSNNYNRIGDSSSKAWLKTNKAAPSST